MTATLIMTAIVLAASALVAGTLALILRADR